MSNYSGAPPWVYKKRMNDQAASYEIQISVLNKRIKELEEENEKLRRKILKNSK